MATKEENDERATNHRVRPPRFGLFTMDSRSFTPFGTTVASPDPAALSNAGIKLPTILEPSSESMREAAAEMLDAGKQRHHRSIVDVAPVEETSLTSNSYLERKGYESIINKADELPQPIPENLPFQSNSKRQTTCRGAWKSKLSQGAAQIPAVALVCLLNLMISIPFGVSYFPIGWKSASESLDDDADEDDLNGAFPLQGKEALGIRMFLFATIVGQLAMTFTSRFSNPVSLQMVENVPFYHALAHIAIQEQGYGVEALASLFFLLGLSSIVVGVMFYILGTLELGKVMYFFPSHVLVGCIGGIGVFISFTAIEVSLNTTISLDQESFENLRENFELFAVVLGFELVLRLLTAILSDGRGHSRFPLFTPLYFCMITPLFYIGLWLFRVDVGTAVDAGYFFPPSDACDPSAFHCEPRSGWNIYFNKDLVAMWSALDLRLVSWSAVMKAAPTVAALAAFSLIHVPINIPSFAISTDVDTDMNAELIAHGCSNALSGLFGGLQNYMTYSNSVLYAKSGGRGWKSSIAVVGLTTVLFVVGPEIVTYIPRCMAGCLLLHIAVDLVLEGVYDSIGSYDRWEYFSIWAITLAMTVFGMTAALLTGLFSAMATFAIQSITYHNPIRGTMSASTLRSSRWNRATEALAILDNPKTGRSRIIVLQLQGHLFFGNVAQITDSVKATLSREKDRNNEPIVVVVDFTLVVGMDSSAAHAVVKLKKIMHQTFGVEVTIFVTGTREGFPCEYALSQELAKAPDVTDVVDWNDITEAAQDVARGSITVSKDSESLDASESMKAVRFKDKVCESLDAALIFAEDMLIARSNKIVPLDDGLHHDILQQGTSQQATQEDEEIVASKYLSNLCKGAKEHDVRDLLSYFRREVYAFNEVIWTQSSESTSAKLLVSGTVMSYLDGTDTSEEVRTGNMFGELGLVEGIPRLSTVVCNSSSAIVYSLSRECWDVIRNEKPRVARILDEIVIRYLAHRVQHVSNRIFETRCLPI